MIDWYTDNVRLINFVLLFLVIAAMTTTILIRRSKATRRVRRVMMWVYAIFLNFAYGTADNLHDNIRVNPPVIIATGLLAGLLIALAWSPQGDDQHPPDDGALGTRFLVWVDHKVVQFKSRHGMERKQNGNTNSTNDSTAMEDSTQQVQGPVHRPTHLRRSA